MFDNYFTIYTDGSYMASLSSGGWAAHLEDENGKTLLMSGGEMNTTNNRMELLAVITALESIDDPARVHIYSDSQYVVNAIIKGWIINWEKNGWMTSGWKSAPKPVKNKDLFERLLVQIKKHRVKMHWVKGHANGLHPMNELVDVKAQEEAKNIGLKNKRERSSH